MNLAAIRSVVLPEDKAGFVRRECPHCHRQFKTRRWDSDAAAVARRLTRDLPHENPHELAGAPLTRRCAYCGREGSTDAFLSTEQRAWLEGLGRALTGQLRHERLLHIQRTLSLNPRPTFVPVEPPPPRFSYPDDRDDFRLEHFVCCQEEAKVERYWSRNLRCPRCAAVQVRGPTRVQLPLPLARA